MPGTERGSQKPVNAKMNLVIDIGNSRTKAAVFSGEKIVERWSFGDFGRQEINEVLRKYPEIRNSILSATRGDRASIENILRESVRFFIPAGDGTPVPLKNLYRTPATLGPDRLAAAVGAGFLFPGQNLMIADLGSAITIDFVTAAGEYLGGSISPGARLRFRALHDHTGKLPMGSLDDAPEGIAGTTSEAVAAGVAEGIRHEIEGYMREFADKMPGLRLILTGGDAEFFEKRFKNTIFANYDLVLIGLNRILDYNVSEHDNF